MEKEKKQEIKKKRGPYALFFKRFFDVLLSLIAIIVLAPVFIIVYLLSLIILRGNPIFKQYRPGKNNKIFKMYKFRSMTNKTDKDGNLLPDKDRITTYGKILRKLSLDELPQLFNILKGDMSIVGPRPRLVEDAIFYDEEVLKYYDVRPGLTGPAQVYDRNSELSWESVFARDKEYSNNVTLINDLKLFFGTFISIFKGGSSKGAEDTSLSHKREYFYGAHLVSANKISKEQYREGVSRAKQIIKDKGKVVYQPDLINQENQNEEVESNG